MKKERNELLEFLAGMAMLVVGLYLLTTHVECVIMMQYCGKEKK